MFYFYFAGGWRGTSGVADFGWHYYAVVATQGAANPQLYIDGAAEPIQYSGGSATIDLNPSASPLYLGAQIDPVYTYYGDTVLDDVSIWNTALSQATIQANMNQPPTGTEPGLVASWQFNEGAGGIAHDQTSNHNDASLGGGVAADSPLWVPSGPAGVDIAGGTLTGTGTINASVQNSGLLQVNPPSGTGVLTINGNYIQTAAGTLSVNIGGLAAGTQFDQLNVTEQASLDGALSVNVVNNYSPPQGDSYQILNFASETGNFSAEFGLYFGGGGGFAPPSRPAPIPPPSTSWSSPRMRARRRPSSRPRTPRTTAISSTFTATVQPLVSTNLVPGGQVVFFDGTTQLGTVTLVNGSATYTTRALLAGSHSIIAQYSGDSNFGGSNSTAFNQVVNQDATTIAVAASVNPTVWGQSVTFTATVASAVSGTGTPTGQVTFYDGSTAIDTATLVNGTASYTTSALAVAGHAITAIYGGNTDFSGSTSTAFTQVVNQAGTTTGVTTSVNPSVWGQAVTFTATVSAVTPGSGTPTGQVIFYDGTTAIDTETLVNGSASFTTSALAVAGHAIVATYGGDTNFSGSTSTAFTQVVNQDGTTTAVESSVNPSVWGQAVTFTATVTAAAPGGGTPAGQVIFYDGATAIDTETLVNGSASYSTSGLTVRGHAITVQYQGNTDYAPSTSPGVTQTVDQAGSTTTVSSSANPAEFGQPVTFTATVTATAPGSGTPTGTVTFYDGTMAIDTETLSGGTATFTTSALGFGDHAISDVYGGDTDFTGSTSPTLTQTVSQESSTTTASSSVNPTVYGQSVTFTATVSATPPATGTPTGAVTFYDGTTAIDTATLSNGSASYSTSALAVGGHSITARFNGDTDFTGSTSTAFTQTVNQDGSATVVTSSENPSFYGQGVTFTATVTAAAPGGGTPTGQVTFYDGTTAIDTETLSGGTASYTTSALSLGVNSITAQYAGDSNFTGSDSTALTQTINVPPPVASSQTVLTAEDVALPVILVSTDPNGDPLTYTVTTPPADGQLSGSGADLTYAPDAGFTGSDSFRFTATDTTTGLVSNTATVAITVAAPPVAKSQSVATGEGNAKALTLDSTDPNGDPLTFTVTSEPSKGVLSGSGANLTYTPAASLYGQDNFQFTVTDTTTGLVSNTATVSLTIVPPPVASGQLVVAETGVPQAIALTSTDPNGDPLAYSVTVAAGERPARRLRGQPHVHLQCGLRGQR